MFLLEFFRDFLSGFMYYIYVALCIFAFFYVLGIVADRKRQMIEKKLREKKQYDIESGKEAAIAAMESKQVLDVDDDVQANPNVQIQGGQDAGISMQLQDVNQKEEVPSVMVLDSSTLNQPVQNAQAVAQPAQVPTQGVAVTQQQLMKPLVQNQAPALGQQPLGVPAAQQPAQVQNAGQPAVNQPLIINSK
jgi:hypothetical protein